jgi:hypothetical protein
MTRCVTHESDSWRAHNLGLNEKNFAQTIQLMVAGTEPTFAHAAIAVARRNPMRSLDKVRRARRIADLKKVAEKSGLLLGDLLRVNDLGEIND